jgi:ABC-type multidrug transport system ATPase subunit
MSPAGPSQGANCSPSGGSVAASAASVGGRHPLLELEHLAVSYGGIQAVKGIDIVVGDGELACLIGANGAGKTTTLKGICGLLPVKRGTIRYAGEDITGRPAYTLVRRGLSLVPEGRGMFGALTIDENLATSSVCSHCFRGSRSGAGKRPGRCRAASSRCWRSRGP